MGGHYERGTAEKEEIGTLKKGDSCHVATAVTMGEEIAETNRERWGGKPGAR